jgi:hypothetical protein
MAKHGKRRRPMAFGTLIRDLFNGPTGVAIIGIAILWLVELVTGISRAFASKQFDWELVDVSVRTQLAGRVIPIVVVLIAGAAAPDLSVLGVSINVLTTAGLAASATYAAAAIASIVGNLNPQTADVPPTE